VYRLPVSCAPIHVESSIEAADSDVFGSPCVYFPPNVRLLEKNGSTFSSILCGTRFVWSPG